MPGSAASPPASAPPPRRRSTCVLINTPENYDDDSEDVMSFGGRANGHEEPLGSWSEVEGRVLRESSQLETSSPHGTDDGEEGDEEVPVLNGRYRRTGSRHDTPDGDRYHHHSHAQAGAVNGISAYVESTGGDHEDSEEPDEFTPLLLPHPASPTSTETHTILNSINLLMGMGILTLPYAMSLCGWVVGISLLILFPLLASTTAKILVKCMEVRPTMLPIFSPGGSSNGIREPSTPTLGPQNPHKSMSYGDIAQTAFGPRGKTFVSALYIVELFAACTALVILVADSLHALYPQFSLQTIKLGVAACMVVTTWFRTVSMLTYASFVGVVAIVNLLFIIVFDGVTNPTRPGSLLDPAETDMWPRSWQNVALAVGIMFVGFDGHAVLPTIYRDLKTPTAFPFCINVTYVTITALYLTVSVSGYLMFGNTILPEITQNLPTIPAYNPALNQLTVYLVALNPLAKYALTIRPVHSSLEHWTTSHWQRIIVRTLLTLLVLGTTLAVPSFDRVMGLIGSAFSGSVAVIVPCACYAKLFWRGVGSGRKALTVLGLTSGVTIVVVGLVGVLWGRGA
ncbi:hypothetical protein HKX48_005107 [Thoreauomyces humboldtii]|nr:hypothetical protein HKX48_005107 [Thoreauomyces humboldtii]